MDRSARESSLHSSAGKGSRRERCFPQAKDSRQSSPLLWAEEQEWRFPTYFPLYWPYQHGRQHATKPQRKQTCNENRHAAKNARRKQFWLGGNAWVTEGQAWLNETMPRSYGAVTWRTQQPVMNPFKGLHVFTTALKSSASWGLLNAANL